MERSFFATSNNLFDSPSLLSDDVYYQHNRENNDNNRNNKEQHSTWKLKYQTIKNEYNDLRDKIKQNKLIKEHN